MECEVDAGDIKPDVKPDLAALASDQNARAGTSSSAFSSLIPGCATPSTPKSHNQKGDANRRAAGISSAGRSLRSTSAISRKSTATLADYAGATWGHRRATEPIEALRAKMSPTPGEADLRFFRRPEETPATRTNAAKATRRHWGDNNADRIIARKVAADYEKPRTTSPASRPAPPYVRLCWSACLLAGKSWGDVGESAAFVIPAVYLIPTSMRPLFVEKATSI